MSKLLVYPWAIPLCQVSLMPAMEQECWDKLSPPAQVLEQTVMSNNLLLGNERNVLLTFEFLPIMLSCLSQSLD